VEGNDVTGLKVWAGAKLLCELVKRNSNRFSGKSVLELGSGVGLSGKPPYQIAMGI
jgi:predicted nicotinamide N-methyase